MIKLNNNRRESLMKFWDKIVQKFRNVFTRQGLVKAGSIAVLATTIVTFAACNKPGQKP